MKSIGLGRDGAGGFSSRAPRCVLPLIDKLLTRIVSKDNLYKGLSTFAVEMLELRNIFNRATPNTLSYWRRSATAPKPNRRWPSSPALILKLREIGSLFIFATHLHQLPLLERDPEGQGDRTAALRGSITTKRLTVLFMTASSKAGAVRRCTV